MKILHYISSFNIGGIETMLVNLVNLQVKKHEVGILILTNNINNSLVERVDSRVKLYKIGKPVGSKNLFYIIRAFWKYRKFNPDVFHFHDHNAAKFFLYKGNKEKRFATIHNVIPTKWNKTIDEYIAISNCVKEGFLKQTGKDNCIVFYNGIDLTSFICKKQYNERPQKFLSIGRLYPSKGMDIVINAFALIKEEEPDTGVTLDIWGEGQERESLERLIEEKGLTDTVKLRGNVNSDYVEKHISDFDCVIQASRHEGFGLTAIESMASGVPTILSNIDGYAEVSKNGMYSFLFEADNEKELKKAVISLGEDYSSAVRLASLAKQYVFENYSIITLDRNLDNLYRR